MATSTTEMVAPARPETGRALRTIAPRVDIYETDSAYVLLADMPGVKPDDLEVVAERNSLIVRGRAAQPDEPPDYQEFELGEYQRAFSLTEDLDAERMTASLRDGVLRVDVPKSPGVQPKKIPVRTE
jgi:HSP20 family molecular chaperone IbpA